MQALQLAHRRHRPATCHPRFVVWSRGPGTPSRHLVGPVAAFLVTLLLLLTMLPSMAAVPTVAGEPRPLPAPAPVTDDDPSSADRPP